MQAFKLSAHQPLQLRAPARQPLVLCKAAAPKAAAPKAAAKATIKRAPSAYNLFVKEQFSAVKQQLEKQKQAADFTAVTKAVRAKWTSLSEKDKARYNSESAQLKEEVAAAKKAAAGPPRPVSAYAAFTREMFATVKAQNPNKPTTEITKLIAEKWKALPQANKDARSAQFKAEMEKYKALVASSAPAAAAAASAPKAAPKAAAKAAPAPAAPKAAPAPAAPAPAASRTPGRATSRPRSRPPSVQPPQAAPKTAGTTQTRASPRRSTPAF